MQFQNLRVTGKLSERVREQLEQAILAGKVKVNEQLPTEVELGESFGVSRTVIREALQRLEAQGLVESRIGSGTYVAPFGMDQIKTVMGRFAALNPHRDVFLQLLDLREVIEVETSARAAELDDPAVISELRAILQKMHQTRDDMEAFANADMEFHLCIANAANNPFFAAAILEPVRNLVRNYSYQSAPTIERTCDLHERILKAIADGDAQEAQQQMREHFAFAREHYLKMVAPHKPAEVAVSRG